ncbi:hypothetical protein NDU88_008306 [Pleurodeles waltl]|uniref:Uncharacterized protein n=1 Tax=Pleurodeles waltl TaxID=8319 RepID=A0AAV7QU62_PLEWA|nr:hypothetical protein NDU88_008306 [Pleurodeles waltl]
MCWEWPGSRPLLALLGGGSDLSGLGQLPGLERSQALPVHRPPVVRMAHSQQVTTQSRRSGHLGPDREPLPSYLQSGLRSGPAVRAAAELLPSSHFCFPASCARLAIGIWQPASDAAFPP